jgi:hypothetical protein
MAMVLSVASGCFAAKSFALAMNLEQADGCARVSVYASERILGARIVLSAGEDVLLSEFENEIDGWVIEKLQSIGCDTAKSVLALSPEDVARRADLEDETVAEVFDILRAEFED